MVTLSSKACDPTNSLTVSVLVLRASSGPRAIGTREPFLLRADPHLTCMNPLHATIGEFAAKSFTHIECFCPLCRMIWLRPRICLPKISMGLNLAQLSTRLCCAECSGPFRSLKLLAAGCRAR
jgi:hypothetical protein